MAELSQEQKRAIAIAQARARAQKASTEKPDEYDHKKFMAERAAIAKAKVAAGHTPEHQDWAEMSEADRQAIYNMSGGKVRANLIGDVDPTTQNPGETAGSLLNKAGEGMTGGLVGDEASAAVESLLPGVNYEDRRDHYRQQEEVLDRAHPVASTVADIGGAMAMPGGALLGSLARGGNLGWKMAKSGAIGGALSAIYGFAEGEGGLENRLDSGKQAGTSGAIISSMIPVLGAAGQKVADKFTFGRGLKRAARDLPDIEGQAASRTGQAYNDVERLGVEIKAEKFDDMRQEIVNRLLKGSAYSKRPGGTKRVPMTASVVDDMRAASDEMLEAGGQNPGLPFQEFEGFRQDLGAATGNFSNKADQRAGHIVKDVIDETIENLQPSDVTRGDAEALSGAITKARKLYHQLAKAGEIDDAIEAADGYAAGFSRGIKTQFRNIWRNKKRRSKFNEAEQRLIKRIIDGSISERFLDAVGSGLTQVGGVLGIGFGAAGLNPAAMAGGAALYGGSRLARAGASNIAEKNARIVQALIESGRASQIPTRAKIPARYRPIIEQLGRQGTAAALQQ